MTFACKANLWKRIWEKRTRDPSKLIFIVKAPSGYRGYLMVVQLKAKYWMWWSSLLSFRLGNKNLKTKRLEDRHLYYPAPVQAVGCRYQTYFRLSLTVFPRGKVLIDFVNSPLIFRSLSFTLFLSSLLSVWTLLWKTCPVLASLTLLGLGRC